MKLYWAEGDPYMPDEEMQKFFIEPADGNFWIRYDNKRSAGKLPDAPINELLKWILHQINFGQMSSLVEGDDVVSLTIGKEAARSAANLDEAAQIASTEDLALQLNGLLAEAREKGTSEKTAELESRCLSSASVNARRRMEIHYGLLLCALLGRISKRLPKLEVLPIIDKAPAATRAYIAEATRCYLLNMNRACIALCRACLEETLGRILATEVDEETPLIELIRLCERKGILGGSVSDAHYVRIEGNRVLHLSDDSDDRSKIATVTLEKTRSILRHIYS